MTSSSPAFMASAMVIASVPQVIAQYFTVLQKLSSRWTLEGQKEEAGHLKNSGKTDDNHNRRWKSNKGVALLTKIKSRKVHVGGSRPRGFVWGLQRLLLFRQQSK